MSRRQRPRIEALERRRDWLAERLKGWHLGDPSRTRLEIQSINWALTVIRHAEEHGILSDLEMVTR